MVEVVEKQFIIGRWVVLPQLPQFQGFPALDLPLAPTLKQWQMRQIYPFSRGKSHIPQLTLNLESYYAFRLYEQCSRFTKPYPGTAIPTANVDDIEELAAPGLPYPTSRAVH